MIHLSEGRIQAMLDGELADAEREEALRHLATCAECAAELSALRSAAAEFSAALDALDTTHSLDEARAAIGRRVMRRRVQRVRGSLLRAAAMILGFAAVGSAAVPGSPVRGWIGSAVRGLAAMMADEQPTAPHAVEEVIAGVSVAPHEGRVRIQLANAAPEARLRVRLTDAAQASVQVVGESSAVRFLTGPGRIDVHEIDEVLLVVEIPVSARDARIALDDADLVVKDGDVLRVAGGARVGREVELPLAVDHSMN